MLDRESVTAEYKEVLDAELAGTQAEPEGPHCEYCGAPLKAARQARAVHLRYCPAYKATKANGHTPAVTTNDTSIVIDQGVTLTPERTSKLWQAITGGTLTMAVEGGRSSAG